MDVVCKNCIHFNEVTDSGCGNRVAQPIAGILSRNIHANHWIILVKLCNCFNFSCDVIANDFLSTAKVHFFIDLCKCSQAFYLGDNATRKGGAYHIKGLAVGLKGGAVGTQAEV